jgi:hypothetical protein
MNPGGGAKDSKSIRGGVLRLDDGVPPLGDWIIRHAGVVQDWERETGLRVFPELRLGHTLQDRAGFLVVNHDIGIRAIDNVAWSHAAGVVGIILRPRSGIARK